MPVVEFAEHAARHQFREADDGIERRAQLVAHVGEELQLGAIGAFSFRFLFKIPLRQFGELLRLRFESLPRALEIMDHRRQPALRIR